jgi:hypothetical protein
LTDLTAEAQSTQRTNSVIVENSVLCDLSCAVLGALSVSAVQHSAASWRERAVLIAGSAGQSIDEEINEGLLAAGAGGELLEFVRSSTEHAEEVLGQHFRLDVVADLAALNAAGDDFGHGLRHLLAVPVPPLSEAASLAHGAFDLGKHHA